jgi:NAD(P)-dependent dehydrogenase (short-subunit alcohol dehydrogenase family)
VSEARRVAVVTGASSGIGRTIATELGRLGWAVAIGARRVDRLAEAADEVRAAGGEPYAHALDVSDEVSIETFVEAVERDLGPIDVLVNNAAMSTPGWLHDIPTAKLREEIDTNLLGPILITRAVVASLRARGAPGDLVFITSDASRNPRPRMATYTATKAGLEALAHSLAMECEGSGIRSITVRVGPTLSEFGFGWPMESLEDLMAYWPRFGLQRHAGVLDPSAIAHAVVVAVTAPVGVHFDTIEVQPEAPIGSDAPAQIIERPTDA